jgi:hypothetical protein
MSIKNIKNVSLFLDSFKKKIVMILEQIMQSLNCSAPTARRRLKELETYTSYNKNGRYYVLPDIPKFNQHGIWNYEGIYFSKYGTLKNTVIHIIKNSECGLTSAEIENIVDIPAKSFLSHFQNEPELIREQIGKKYIYFSSDKKILKVQKHKCFELSDKNKLIKLPNNIEAIAILVNRIKYPQLDITQLSEKLRKNNIIISAETIQLFFEKNGILKKNQNL